jgi:hypothetical protein
MNADELQALVKQAIVRLLIRLSDLLPSFSLCGIIALHCNKQEQAKCP